MTRMRIAVLLVVVSLLLLVGCGGGSSGTDSGGVRSIVAGRVVTSSQLPLSGATVSLEQSGDSATTDSNGTFRIDTYFSANGFTLRIVGNGLDNSVKVEATPLPSRVINVFLQADIDKNSIELLSISVEPIADAEPTPDSGDPHDGDVSTPPVVGAPLPTSSPPHSVFKGTLVYRDNEPVIGAVIMVEEISEHDRTDSRGTFSIKTPVISGNVTLRVTLGSFSNWVQLLNIPERPVIVTMKLRLSLPSSDPQGMPPTQFPPDGSPPGIEIALDDIAITNAP